MKPLNVNKESCTPVSSNCVIYQGPELECIGLCKGASITQVTYEMATKICQILDTLNVDNYDISCLNSTNCPPETFIELIQLIIQSICDINVQNGEDGENGNYTEVEAFAPGLHSCTNGGISITTYDGATGSQINQFFICNPVNGTDGATGPQGPRGDYVQIVAASVGQCPTGGVVIQLIDGETADTLSENVICNGTDGNYVETRDATVEECPNGGVAVVSYNGVTGTIISTSLICVPDCGCTECIEAVTYVLDSDYPDSVYTPTIEDCFVLVETTTDDTFVVNLDNEVEGKKYTVKNMHSSVYPIAVNSTLYNIDGSASSFSLIPDKAATFIFAQGEWRILSTNFDY